MNSQLRERLIKSLVQELKSSTVRGSDADWYIGFGPDSNTPVEESESDPKTGKVINNTTIGGRNTYLQQWDADNVGYVEEEDERDSGTYSFRLQKY